MSIVVLKPNIYACHLLILIGVSSFFSFVKNVKSTYPFIYVQWFLALPWLKKTWRKNVSVEQIFFIKKKKNKNKNRLLMFQTKPTKPIKLSRSNHIAIGRKTDLNRYALVLIITKPIPIGLVTNLKKNRAYQTSHTPTLLT